MEFNRFKNKIPDGKGQPLTQNNPDKSPEENGGSPDFQALVEEFSTLLREGRIPEDFDMAAAAQDQAFIALTIEYPMDAAIRIYAAEKRAEEAESGAKQRVETDLYKRRALPKSQRANLSVSPSPDYKHMSGEEFRRLEQQYKRSAMVGKKVNL